MTPIDQAALVAALPPGTVVTVTMDGSNQLFIGSSFQTTTDATPWTNDGDGDTPEQAVARCYFFATLQQQLGDAYAAASSAGTLPTWTPGASLPD